MVITCTNIGKNLKLDKTVAENIPDHILVQDKRMVSNGRPLTSHNLPTKSETSYANHPVQNAPIGILQVTQSAKKSMHLMILC